MAESRMTYRNSDGVRRTSIVDTDRPDQITIYTEADMTETIESVKRMREAQDPKSTHRHLARVPMTVYEKSILEDWDDADWDRWLNDPDNAMFRVWQGRV